MVQPLWDATRSRRIRRRVVVEGALVARTPIHLGAGDSDGLVDLTLLRDTVSNRPILTGASLAGALRNTLRARELGEFQVGSIAGTWETILFGGGRADDNGEQSALIIDDSLGIWPAGDAPSIERRDGIALDGASRTAEDQKKFDLELWPAGTRFPLRCELLETDDSQALLRRAALATALSSLASHTADIRLGARKSRGFGQVAVERWLVTIYDFRDPADLLAWLAAGEELTRQSGAHRFEGSDISSLLSVEILPDRRSWVELSATFGLVGSLLIRSETNRDDIGPDAVHLHSWRPNVNSGTHQPILSGTSLAGALRARAQRIARLLATSSEVADNFVDTLFGSMPQGSDDAHSARASRLQVDEQVIGGVRDDLVQTRVQLDRFTGGVVAGALFSEQPVFGAAQSTVTIRLRLANPKETEIGLLLLLLKDLWTGDLPLGGEIGIGRGRLTGHNATLRRHAPAGTDWVSGDEEWSLRATGQHSLVVTPDHAQLEGFIRDLGIELGKTKNAQKDGL